MKRNVTVKLQPSKEQEKNPLRVSPSHGNNMEQTQLQAIKTTQRIRENRLRDNRERSLLHLQRLDWRLNSPTVSEEKRRSVAFILLTQQKEKERRTLQLAQTKTTEICQRRE